MYEHLIQENILFFMFYAAVPNETTDLLGPQCYHQDDYSIFYNNIKDNVAKRIAAYKTN